MLFGETVYRFIYEKACKVTSSKSSSFKKFFENNLNFIQKERYDLFKFYSNDIELRFCNKSFLFSDIFHQFQLINIK